MPTIAPSQFEQGLQPGEQPAAAQVFSGVYGTFAEAAQGQRERRQLVDGEVVTVELDPALEFVRARFAAAESDIAPLDSQQMRASQMHDQLMTEARATAADVYADKPTAIAAREAQADRVIGGFISRAATMVASGEADGLTVKTFFYGLGGLKYRLSSGYNDLVRKTDEPVPDEPTAEAYNQAVTAMFTDDPNATVQHNGGFIHVNSELYANSTNEHTGRYYLSPRLNGDAAEVVQIWKNTLTELGLDEKIYYKLGTHLARRYDTVVVYEDAETADDEQRAVQAFLEKCPPDLLSDTNMPSGIAVGKGVSRAPVPSQLNTLLRYRGKEIPSYNELTASMTELALRRASYDFMRQGLSPEQVTPAALAAAGESYFGQFMKLLGIDPTTMRAA